MVQLLGSTVLVEAARRGATASFQRNGRFHSSFALWSDCLEKFGPSQQTPILDAFGGKRAKSRFWKVVQAAAAPVLARRRDLSHPPRVLAVEEAQSRLPDLLDELKRLVDVARPWFKACVLAEVVKGKSGSVARPLVGAMGTPEAQIDLAGQPPCGSVVVATGDGGYWLSLGPFYQFHDGCLVIYNRLDGSQLKAFRAEDPNRVPVGVSASPATPERLLANPALVRWSGEGGSKSLREITARPQASGGSLWPFALFLAALAAFAVWWKWARRSRKN